jgi:hypothetical protein
MAYVEPLPADVDWNFISMLSLMQQQYPGIIPLLQQPGVFDVVSRSITEKWAPDRLQLALTQTDYYLNTPKSKREWDAFVITDPATARQITLDTWQMVNDMSRQLGVGFEGMMGVQFVQLALEQQWTPEQIKYQMLLSSNKKVQGGAALAMQAAQINAMAEAYGLPIHHDQAIDYATRIQAGSMDMFSVQGTLLEQAKSMYPALSPYFDRGGTMRDYAAPYFALAANELGINPNQIDLNNPKWTALIFGSDGKGGQTINSMQDALKMIRNDPAFGFDGSSRALEDASTLAEKLMQRMGAAA